MKSFMKDIPKRKTLSEVASGNIPVDTLITNGTLFNVFTKEFIKKQSIWIKNRMIAYAGPDHDPPKNSSTQVINAEGMVILPGLIEGHTHLNKSGVEEYIKHLIPTGVTTVVMETIDIGLITGREGIESLVKELENQPIRFYHTIAPICCLTLSEEIHAPIPEEFLTLLKNPKCLGLGEIFWGNLFLEGKQGERVRELVSIALEKGKLVEGHTAGASGRKLQAYTSFGISSDHEPITAEEIIERLRLGYLVMIREGSVRKELSGVKGIFKKKVDFRRLSLTTDGVDPQTFMDEGYLDASLKTLLNIGAPPALAYQMVTLNVAEHFHLDHLIGSLSPGKNADLLIIPSPKEFIPQLVMCNGRMIYRNGKATVQPRKTAFPSSMFHTVAPPDITISSLSVKGKVRVIELVTGLVTKESIINLENPEGSQDVISLLALDRVARQGSFRGILKGFGLQRGAYGTTMTWDSIDMLVAGCDIRSMETVIRRLKEIGGGGVYAMGDEVVAEVATPLCGFYSLKPMEILSDEVKKLENTLRENGVRWDNPTLTIDTLGSPAIPHLRISHQGYVRLKDRKILTVEV